MLSSFLLGLIGLAIGASAAREGLYQNGRATNQFSDFRWYGEKPYLRGSAQAVSIAVADIIDTLQPYLRRNAFRDDPLWQLNELWTMDKHRTIPISPYSLNVGFAMDRWERFVNPVSNLDNYFEVIFPLGLALTSQVDLEPRIAVDILFGDGSFEVSHARLSEINNFVRNDVIPRFAGFFQ